MIFKRKKKNNDDYLRAFGKVKADAFNFDLIETYFTNKRHEANFQVLSDKTCQDLDFDELFMFVDRTHSKVGQQYLYDKLRCIPLNQEDTERNEVLIRAFREDAEFRINTQKKLEKLSQHNTHYITSLFQDEHIQAPKWFFLIRTLSFTSLLALLLFPFNGHMFFVLFGVFMINIGIHYWNKRNLYYYIKSIPKLLKLANTARSLYAQDRLKCINPNLTVSLKLIDKLRFRMSFFKLGADPVGEFEAAFWIIMELVKTLFLLEPLLLFDILRKLDTKRAEIEALFVFVGEIDALISITSLREGCEKCCLPKITEGHTDIIAEGLYHPLIIDAVSNSIRVDDKSILLTGSNMSGKTTFIRTIGINALTGLTLNTCFGHSFSLPRIRIFSAIRISDDLLNDRSYYFEEVLTIKEMIDESKSGKTTLFLLDEIFKGTNTVERISAGKAILSSLAQSNNFVFVSTHDIELADLLQEEYELYHFSEIVGNKTVDFDYKLKEGKLKNRNAIKILRINDYPDAIITEAYEIAKELDGALAMSI